MSQQNPAAPKTRPWPDMSAYGIHFGVVDLPNGEKRMVMVDRDGAWRELSRRMGFVQSRWFGLYVKAPPLQLNIPGFETNFPSAKIVQLTDQEIRKRIVPFILERRDNRLSLMNAGKGRLSWHPTRTVVAEAAAQASDQADDDSVEATLNPEAALRQTIYLGLNSQGQEVLEAGDGLRFAKLGDQVVARESREPNGGPLFLRASTDEELKQVASGAVREIEAGRRLHSDDFIRYMEAVFGAESSDDKAAVGRFHAAIDGAMLERVSAHEGAGSAAFEAALQLHEGRPPFWRAPGSWSTPLPMSVVMQSLALASPMLTETPDATKVIDVSDSALSHGWALNAERVDPSAIPEHDVAIGAVFGKETDWNALGGVKVTRTDTEALLASLEKRNPSGLTVFTLTATKAGRLDNEFRRVLSALGQRYEISGLVDIDAALIGPGADTASRLVVVGKKMADPNFAFSVPATVPVIFDYAGLWGWAETLRASRMGDVLSFGDDGREENRWQAPYIPSSQVSEPEAMSPRNLLGPVRMALADIVERNGLGIDEFVCSKLGWTFEQLEQRLSAEQTDAVAIGIQSIDDGMGMVEADATGLGKGRVTATLALYARRIGMPVMFMTEKSDLFSDFYRDVADIGSKEELGKPFIVNNDLIVRDTVTMEEIARSPKKDEAQVTLACGEFPEGYDLVMATYSQFNRNYDSRGAARSTAIARSLRELLKPGADVFKALTDCGSHLGLTDYAKQGISDLAGAIAYERSLAQIYKAKGDTARAAEVDANADLLSLSPEAMQKALASRIKADSTTLKQQWLYSGAMNGALLILDESHVAAGETSQTGTNLRFLVENAGAVTYSSATFAKGIGNFILYSRLFPDSLRVATVGETLSRGGEAMQEIVSGMLAKDGKLIRREHDLSNLEFKVSVDRERKVRNETWANGFAQVLAAMSVLSGEVSEIASGMNAELEKALKKAVAQMAPPGGWPKGSSKAQKQAAASVESMGVQYTNFSSKFYNLSRAFMMAVNADQSADLAIKALNEGRKPVVTVENTMETVLKELVHGVELEFEGETNPELDSRAQLSAADPLAGVTGTSDLFAASEQSKKARAKPAENVELGRHVSFKDILNKYVDSMFTASEQIRLGGRVQKSRRISLLKPEMAESIAEIRKLIEQMPEVPLSPIDLVRDRISKAGFSVDEISGRRMRLELNGDGTHRVVRMSERKKAALKNAFNNGSLDALILSKSGSTGISLHASRTFANQSQRELIELQPAADIAQRLQFWGRVNRKGQVCQPIIHMVSSGLPAEMRLITMQNTKLRKMSANISGNADNSALNEEVPDILNRIGNEVCYRWMEANPGVSKIIGYEIGEIPEEEAIFGHTKFVDKLTGRLLMLSVPDQERVYKEITAEFNAVIEQYELEGRNPLKATEFDLRAKRGENLVMQVATGLDSVFNEAVVASEISYQIRVPGLDREEVVAAAAEGKFRLIAEHGEKYPKVIINKVKAVLSGALEDMLPKRFTSVAAAIADPKPNAVRNAAIKFEWLVDRLPRLTPGAIIVFNEKGVALNQAHADLESGGFQDKIYVTGWKTPDTNVLSMAEYKLVGYSYKTRKKVEVSLSSLAARSSWIPLDPLKHTNRIDQMIADDFFTETKDPINGVETRVILDGNLYRGAEIAEGQKQGTAITYSDERGVWHHAILMPKSVSLDSVMDMPVVVDNVETLIAAFNSGKGRMRVADDLRTDVATHTYSVSGEPGAMFVFVHGAAEKMGWLIADADIKACLRNGDFEGQRGSREAKVLPDREEEFLRAFMKAANTKGAAVIMEGYMRPWYNEYLTNRLGLVVDQKAVDAALADTADDELGALLATPA
ncbi:hypothetical protein ABIC83_002639 [Roseateles asaccharophilus]|uniref:strawberry notch C-terminal domain-containing protein n=1 Tax=Roseateles asaccharophilus TaxID=582607 RepID=UPI003834DBDB